MGNPLRVLIVDGNEADRELMKDCLERAGISAVGNETGSGADVATLYRSDPVDCVLLDYILPGQTGVTVLEELKTPLAALRGSATLLAHEVARTPADLESVGRFAASIARNARRMGALIMTLTEYVGVEGFVAARRATVTYDPLPEVTGDERAGC